MIVIGIDPGLTGAVAMLGHRGELLHMADMPTMEKGKAKGHVRRQVNGAGLAAALRAWMTDYDRNECWVFLETPIAFPGQHVAAIAAAFQTAGIIEGVVVTMGLQLTNVPPAEWKKALALTKSKEQARAKAIRMFPSASLDRVKDHNRAEALLIAKYGHGLVS